MAVPDRHYVEYKQFLSYPTLVLNSACRGRAKVVGVLRRPTRKRNHESPVGERRTWVEEWAPDQGRHVIIGKSPVLLLDVKGYLMS